MHRVLVVDDDAFVARALERVLRRAGADVKVELDGRQAVRVAVAFRPTWVVSDLSMPHCSGVEVLLAVKRELPPTRRALISGDLSRLAPKDREAISPCVLLRKPLSDAELLTALELAPDVAGP